MDSDSFEMPCTALGVVKIYPGCQSACYEPRPFTRCASRFLYIFDVLMRGENSFTSRFHFVWCVGVSSESEYLSCMT